MRKITYTDEQLKRASAIIVQALEKSLPEPSECVAPFEYSQEFLNKLERLIKRGRRRETVQHISRRVASVVLAMLIGVGAWLTVDTEARAAFVTWVREVYEDSFLYEYFGEKPTEKLKNYEITGLSDGYELVTADCSDTLHIKIYQKDDDAVMLMYYQVYDERKHIIENSGVMQCTWEPVSIRGIGADFYCYEDSTYANELFWIDERSNVAFQLSAYWDKDKMIKIAESIK